MQDSAKVRQAVSSYLLPRLMSRPFTALDAAVRTLVAVPGGDSTHVTGPVTGPISWGRARDLIRRGKVSVDGQVITVPTTPVRPDARITVDLAAPDPKKREMALVPEAIVHVDPHIVVVDKPAGISTVPFDSRGMGASIAQRAGRARDEITLDQRVRGALKIRELGIVHRLDKETSGLVVFTRSWAAKKSLLQAFRFHHIHRRYIAIVHGAPASQTIVSHLVEDRGDGVRGSIEHRSGRKHPVGSEKTQKAVTHVELLERFTGGGQPSSMIACLLETGRTHQIRIHLAEAGHPLLGERVYMRGYAQPVIPAPRVMLHAAELGFVHPATGRKVSWSSPLPADMTEMLAFLRGP